MGRQTVLAIRKRTVVARETGELIEEWQCGNAILDTTCSNQKHCVWVTGDGRRSVWRRGTAEDGYEVVDQLPEDSFPW